MSDFEVKMVTVDIEPHDNADALEVARIRGTEYTSVVPIDAFHSGDEALYIPDQAIVPDWLLEEMDLVGKLAGSKRNRVKPISLRGVLSQGILYKPSEESWDLFNDYEWPDPDIGTISVDWIDTSNRPENILDWAPPLGITKWVPEVPLDMGGVQYAPDKILSYTEINDYKKYPNLLDEGEDVVITEKIHGTCAIYHLAYGTLHVSSKGVAKRGLAIEPDDHNLYWKVANTYNIKDKLALIGESAVTLFGEIYGIQDLKYGATKDEPWFRAFDIAINGEYVNYHRFKMLTSLIGIPTVPELYVGHFYKTLLIPFSVGNETVTGNQAHLREGIVVRPTHERRDFRHGRVILKYISNDYLNRKGNTTEYE